MNARFHAPEAAAPGIGAGSTIALPEDEAQHLTRVLRLGVGATIRVFDGQGHEFAATVTEAGRRVVRVTLDEALPAAAEASTRVTLVQAVLKGDSMDAVIRDTVMLGVAAIQPVITDRAEVSLEALARGARAARWERVAISSVKQCGRAVVPRVAAPLRLDDWLATLAGGGAGTAPGLVCVEPGATAATVAVSALTGTAPTDAQLLIGPEGGWSARELSTLTARLTPISLGARTLRAETAPTVALASLFTRWGEL